MSEISPFLPRLLVVMKFHHTNSNTYQDIKHCPEYEGRSVTSERKEYSNKSNLKNASEMFMKFEVNNFNSNHLYSYERQCTFIPKI